MGFHRNNINVMIMDAKNAIVMAILAGAATNLGIFFTYFSKSRVREVISVALSFAMGVMSLISLKELIPISINYFFSNLKINRALLIVIMIPILVMVFVHFFKTKFKDNNHLYTVGILSMASLLLHNLPEGIIVFTSSLANKRLGLKIALSIAAHNLPEGICIAVPIYYSTSNRKKALLYTFLSGVAEPFGAIITWLFLKPFISILFLNIMLYFVGILMITISFLEILPEVVSYQRRWHILIGLLLSLFILFL